MIAEQHGIYPLFSGHNTICVVTALLETGQLPITEPATIFKLEAPGGLISIEARCEQGRVREVRMRSMAAFVGKVTSISQLHGLLKRMSFARKMSKSGCQVLVR